MQLSSGGRNDFFFINPLRVGLSIRPPPDNATVACLLQHPPIIASSSVFLHLSFHCSSPGLLAYPAFPAAITCPSKCNPGYGCHWHSDNVVSMCSCMFDVVCCILRRRLFWKTYIFSYGFVHLPGWSLFHPEACFKHLLWNSLILFLC